MTTVHLKRSDKTVEQIIQAAFPEFTGQKVQASIADSIRFYNTMWDEGNRRTYVYVELNTMKAQTVPQEQYMTRSEFHQTEHPIPTGFVCVVHVESRVPHIEIHGPAANLTGLLPKPSELSFDEKVVLVATRSLKSSYAGISNYRFHQAGGYIGGSLDRWEAAKQTLIQKGLLNKAGAITVDGKNAVGSQQLYELKEQSVN